MLVSESELIIDVSYGQCKQNQEYRVKFIRYMLNASSSGFGIIVIPVTNCALFLIFPAFPDFIKSFEGILDGMELDGRKDGCRGSFVSGGRTSWFYFAGSGENDRSGEQDRSRILDHDRVVRLNPVAFHVPKNSCLMGFETPYCRFHFNGYNSQRSTMKNRIFLFRKCSKEFDHGTTT